MILNDLLDLLENNPSSIEFKDVINLIEALYDYTPAEFSNGLNENKIVNAAGSNEGSCKIFAFAKDQGFTQEQTLNCFGAFYREDVLLHPESNDHANIRHFIKHGWDGIHFSTKPLHKKS